MHSQPLFVVGAPRSGTTFLCQVLNQHPSIQLTNENRIFVLLKDLLEIRSRRPDLIDRDTRGRFVAFLTAAAGDLVEGFYREGLGLTAPIWGDKHPPYADPAVLSGRRGGRALQPQSGSCLRLIRRTLPNAKFIHIHRDPLEVAQSLVGRGWTDSIESGVSVWRQYVTEIVEFFSEIPSEQSLTLAYRDLIDAPDSTAAAIGRFLKLPHWSQIESFLHAQRLQPTPFSQPVSDLSRVYRPRTRVLPAVQSPDLAGNPASLLGYS